MMVLRQANRQLRLDAMGALKKVLESLHASIAPSLRNSKSMEQADTSASVNISLDTDAVLKSPLPTQDGGGSGPPTLVQIYDTKQKLREEQIQIMLRFNQKPAAGIKYAAEKGHLDATNPILVAEFLLKNQNSFEKTQIGDYLGREAEYQGGFAMKVLYSYVDCLDFGEMEFDDAIRYYLSGFRLPGEAQKIDRIMEKFAERFCIQNPGVFPSADAAFILAFSVIMLNTDLHNPAIKEERRMTKSGFRRNNRGICDGSDLPDALLDGMFDRIKENPISLKEDDDAREKVEGSKSTSSVGVASVTNGLNTVFGNQYKEIDKTREDNFRKEQYLMVQNTESLFRQRRKQKRASSGAASAALTTTNSASLPNGISSVGGGTANTKFVRTIDTGLRDEYVTPMFEVTWGPALAVFSTAMESANGALSTSINSMSSDEELNLAYENVTATTELCLSGFRLAICTSGLCGNDTARISFVTALSNFTLLGTARLLEHRHIRCVQALLRLAQEDGEILGETWEFVFKGLSEVARLGQVYDKMARGGRRRPGAPAVADGADPEEVDTIVGPSGRTREEDYDEGKERDREDDENENTNDGDDNIYDDEDIYDDDIFDDEDDDDISDDFDDGDYLMFEREMNRKEIDEANALAIHDALPDTLMDQIYHRSSNLNDVAIKDFILQLCRVSRMEISGYGGHVGSRANVVNDDTQNNSANSQPIIYSFQKLVEVSHYNMETRPRLIFAEIWTTIAGHLTSTALHSNPAVAMYAVDSLRQLSIQFLKREELGVFEFQRRFLKPYEVIMMRSVHVSTKELLLQSVEQIIIMFGGEKVTSTWTAGAANDSKDNGKQAPTSTIKRGNLRSGWRPVLAVLGLASHDDDESIASLGFRLLQEQVMECAPNDASASTNKIATSSLMMDYFVDLVDSLMMFVSGSHEGLCMQAIRYLVKMSDWLADDDVPLPNLKSNSGKQPASSISLQSQEDGINVVQATVDTDDIIDTEEDAERTRRSREFELWWPILLGLSRSVGDARPSIREMALTTLLSLIDKNFFSTSSNSKNSSQFGDVQTLQLIFRGVLVPALEHAEMDTASLVETPMLPDDFPHFITPPPPPPSMETPSQNQISDSWSSSMFHKLFDGCVAICLKSMKVHKNDTLVEDVLAMVNNCLLSDSGALAVRGLRRLEEFVTKDLELDVISTDTWATVCHMLLRCLVVTRCNTHDSSEGTNEYDSSFEKNLILSRRYVMANATKIIGTLLVDTKYSESMGIPWYLFLTSGLGRNIREWEVEGGTEHKDVMLLTTNPCPPHHFENALYGQSLLVRLLYGLSTMDMIMNANQNDAPQIMSVQKMIQEETESIISTYLEKESDLAKDGVSLSGGAGSGESAPEVCRAAEVSHLTNLVCDLLDGYNKLSDDQLFRLAWLCPMLSALIQSNNKTVRISVHALVARMFSSVPQPSKK